MQWIWVLGFGLVGVGLRFAIDTWISRYALSFPFGTLAINTAGCLLAGLLFGTGLQKDLGESQIRVGLIVGFCGGFTTFSGFGLQFMQLMNDGKTLPAIVYGVGSPVLCILATVAGLVLSRAIA